MEWLRGEKRGSARRHLVAAKRREFWRQYKISWPYSFGELSQG
jgi:hypothetical protein